MGVFEDFLGKAKKVAGQVIDKGEELISQGKLCAEITKIEFDLNSAFAKYGRAVYSKAENSVQTSLVAEIERLTALLAKHKAELAALEAEIKAAAQVVVEPVPAKDVQPAAEAPSTVTINAEPIQINKKDS